MNILVDTHLYYCGCSPTNQICLLVACCTNIGKFLTSYSVLISDWYLGRRDTGNLATLLVSVIKKGYTDYSIIRVNVVKNDFISKGRSISDLKAHLVLTTKYRRKAITSQMLHRLEIILSELLVKWDCKLIEFNGEEDHAHVLFQYHPDVQLSIFIGNIKSTTSRKLRQEFTEHLSRIYTKNVFWNGSYFLASCGGVTISTLKQYIKSQDRPKDGDSSSTPRPFQPLP